MVPIQLGSLFRTGIDSRLIGDGEHTITTKEDMRTHRFSIFDPPSRAGSSYRTWERGERVLHAASFDTVCIYMIDLLYGTGGTYIWYSPNPILRSYLDLVRSPYEYGSRMGQVLRSCTWQPYYQVLVLSLIHI